jgi:choline-sulfatase
VPGDLPDLILVMTDQHRFDHLGHTAPETVPVRTPHLDGLAAGGISFTDAYSSATTCVPARTSLLTGLHPHRVEYADRYALRPGFFTLPHALRAAGYQTALIGKMHFNPMRTPHGFEHMEVCEHLNAYPLGPTEQPELDHYHDWLAARGLPDWRYEVPGGDGEVYPYPIETHPTSWVRDRTLAFLEGRDRDRPLFLVVSFPHPHPPGNPPEPYASMYDPADCVIDPQGADLNKRLPPRFRDETAQVGHPARRVDPAHLDHYRRGLARTFGLITQVDDAVGALVPHLPLADGLLWFTADHGDFGGRRGLVRKIPWIPFDDLARVPCFAAGGAVAGSGRVDHAPMQSFDFATTCLDLAGVDVDLDRFDGRSLRAQLADPGGLGDADRMVFTALSQGWPMARFGPRKYVREAGWNEEALFDVVRDPDECWNLTSLDPTATTLDVMREAVDRQLAAPVPDLPSYPPVATS